MKLLILTLSFAAAFAGEGGPESATVTVTQSPLDKVAMKSSKYMNQYCSAADSRLSEDPYRSQFAPDLDQCLNRCNRDPLCTGVDYSAEKTCNQHKGTGRPGDELDWTHYHRRAKTEESCPEGTVQHVIAPSPYGKKFCVYANKKCPGHDLYPKSKNIADTTKCMEKCAKIKSCGSADFKESKCNPKDHVCTPAELVEDVGSTYMQRLEPGQECQCYEGYTRDTEGTCQPDGPTDPCDGKSPQEIEGEAVACHDGNILLMRTGLCTTAGRISFRRNWADYKAGFGDRQNFELGFWAGLDFMHKLTNSANYRLIIEMKHANGNTYTANYENFVVGPESDKYRLSVGAYSGNAGDAFNTPATNGKTDHGSKFSTPDQDNDAAYGFSCANSYGAGWWFNRCHRSILTGACPGDSKYNLGGTSAQQWYPVAWGYQQRTRLDGSYFMVKRM